MGNDASIPTFTKSRSLSTIEKSVVEDNSDVMKQVITITVFSLTFFTTYCIVLIIKSNEMKSTIDRLKVAMKAMMNIVIRLVILPYEWWRNTHVVEIHVSYL